MADYIDEMGIDTRVSPALHPGTLRGFMQERGEYASDVVPLIAPLEDALAVVYQGFIKVNDARDAAERDPTLTKEAKIVMVADLGDKVLERSFAALGKAESTIRNNIATLEKSLSEAVVSKASHHVAVEIRAFVREQAGKGESAMGFVSEAIRTGDLDTAAAILGVAPFLSSLTPEQHAVLLREYNTARNPQAALRIKAMTTALDYYGRAPKLPTVLEKAVGTSDSKVRALRAAQNASKKAFSL